MKLLKLSLIAFLVLGMAVSAVAQDTEDDDFEEEEDLELFKKEKKFKPENIRIGFFPEFAIGSDGYGNSLLYLSINSSIGYRFGDRFEPGIGMFYDYVNYLDLDGDNNHRYGGYQDAKLYIWENLFAYERGLLASSAILSLRIDPSTGRETLIQTGRLSYGNLFLGGGYDFEIGPNAEFSLIVMVNAFTNSAYPERNPIIAMRVAFGLPGRNR